MSGAIDLPLPDAGSLERGRFTYFPVAPGRLEFAQEVRLAILRGRPQCVALDAGHRPAAGDVPDFLPG
jgi:hypothetical protein